MPHSETPGSPIARISPGLFAACRVLHRLSVPRHPPDALLWARSQARQTAPQRVAHQGSPPTGPFGQAPEPRRAQGQAPGRGTPPAKPVDPAAGARMKTLLRTGRPQALACARGPSASVTFANSLHPINQHNPRTPAKAAGRPASRRRPGPGAKPLSSPNAADHRRDAREPARRQRSDPFHPASPDLRRPTSVV